MNNLRIIGFDISNFKRIELFRCKVDNTGLVTIGGENANGKSSVLDALYCALIGVPRNLTNPVREGEDCANIRVLIGTGEEVEYKIIRTFTRGGAPQIRVVGPNDATISNGSAVLKELLSANAVDPVEFLQLQPIDQRNRLAKLVGLDLQAFDTKIEEARARERQLDDYQKTLQAKVDDLPWHEDAPESETSAAELAARLQAATEHNAHAATLDSNLRVAENELDSLNARHDSILANIDRLKRELREQEDALKAHKERVAAHAAKVRAAKEAREKFQPIDTAELSAQMSQIEQLNQKVRDNQARIKAAEEWKAAEAELGQQIEKRKRLEQDKKDALSKAAFPVEGLAFDSQQIIFNGQPFGQASQAERIRVATAIALAMRGRVAPIFIRDASTLDAHSLEAIADMAERHGAQVFAEIVANRKDDGFDRDCTFYVVDGQLQREPEAASV